MSDSKKRREREFIKIWDQIQSAARVVCSCGGGKIRIAKVKEGKNEKITK